MATFQEATGGITSAPKCAAITLTERDVSVHHITAVYLPKLYVKNRKFTGAPFKCYCHVRRTFDLSGIRENILL